MQQEERAVLKDGETVLSARATIPMHAPDSASLRLIRGVYGAHPLEALRLLRKRISISGPLRPWDFGLLKVAAKRWNEGEEVFPAAGKTEEFGELFPPTSKAIRSGEKGMECLERLLGENAPDQSIPLHARARRIAAVLEDPSGRAVFAAVNQSSVDRTRHAELELIQTWWNQERRAIPKGYHILSSLKPCRMCASFIWKCSADPAAVSVEFLEWDPGPHARSTILDSGSYERKIWGQGISGELESQCLDHASPLASVSSP